MNTWIWMWRMCCCNSCRMVCVCVCCTHAINGYYYIFHYYCDYDTVWKIHVTEHPFHFCMFDCKFVQVMVEIVVDAVWKRKKSNVGDLSFGIFSKSERLIAIISVDFRSRLAAAEADYDFSREIAVQKIPIWLWIIRVLDGELLWGACCCCC